MGPPDRPDGTTRKDSAAIDNLHYSLPVTTSRPIRRLLRALRFPRDLRGRTLAAGASLVTVLALVQMPVCAMGMDGCMLPARDASAAAAEGMAGAACPMSAAGAMECCTGEPAEQPPATPDAPGKDARFLVAAQADSCPGTDGLRPVADEAGSKAPAGGAASEVPLYTLLSSYLN